MRNFLQSFLLILFATQSAIYAQPNNKQTPRKRSLEEIRQLPDGAQKLQEILNYTRNPSNINTESALLIDESILYALSNNAIDIYGQLLANKSLYYIYNQNYEEAVSLLDQALESTEKLPELQLPQMYSRIASGYGRLPSKKHHLKAIVLHDRANSIAKKYDDTNILMLRISNLQNQVNVLHKLREYEKIKLINKEIVSLLPGVESPQALLSIKSVLASSMIMVDEIEDASVLLNELMTDIEKDNQGMAPRFFEMMASIYESLGNLEKAAYYYTKQYYTLSAMPQQKMRSSGQLVGIYVLLQKKDSVEKYMKIFKGYETNITTHYNVFEQNIINAVYEEYIGNRKVSKEYLLQNIIKKNEQRDHFPPWLFNTYLHLASFNMDENNIEAASDNILEAEKGFKKNQLNRVLKRKYLALLTQIRKRKNAQSKTLPAESLQLELALRDSLLDSELSNVVTEMEVNYKTKEKEQELLVVRQINEINELELSKSKQKRWILTLSISVLILLMLALIAYVIHRRRHLRIKHHAEIKQLEQQHIIQNTKNLRKVEEEERKKIANKLHDEVGALLSIAKLNVEELDEQLFVADSNASEKIQTAGKMIVEVADTVRNISHTLMPIALEKYGLRAAIEDLLYSLKSSGKIIVEEILEGMDNTDEWSEEFVMGIYRIVQEALNNVIKHAEATNVLVQVVELEDAVTIYIEDNGKGISEEINKETGLGMRFLYSSVEYFNGTIEINGGNTGGTFVLVELKKQFK